MVQIPQYRWFYAVAGSGVVLGLFNYFHSDKAIVNNAWTTNFQPSVKWDKNWDKRDYSALVKAKTDEKDPLMQSKAHKQKYKPTAKRNIFLIRHGQYEIGAKKEAHMHLTALGRKQAELVGQRLKDLKFNYTKMVRSTMTRAMETSNIIHKNFPNLPIESCELCREGAPIHPDPPSSSWNTSDETFLKDGTRIEAAFRKHFHRADVNQTSDSHEIIVCHANVIRYFVCRLLQFPPEAWMRFRVHHCSITWVEIDPSGRVSVYSIGDCGFLPEELMTG